MPSPFEPVTFKTAKVHFVPLSGLAVILIFDPFISKSNQSVFFLNCIQVVNLDFGGEIPTNSFEDIAFTNF